MAGGDAGRRALAGSGRWACRAVWTALWGGILLAGLWPFLGMPPTPRAQAIDQVVHVEAGGQAPASLPIATVERGGTSHFRVLLEVNRTERPLYLFVPLLSQHATIHMEGRLIADSDNRTVMEGLASGTSLLAVLPEDLLGAGPRAIDIHLQATGLQRAYLSRLYVGTAEELAPYYRLSVLVLEHLRAITVGAQLLMAVLALVIWLYRPREPLFRWLVALLALSLVTSILQVSGLATSVNGMGALAPMLGSSACLILVIVSLLLGGASPPRWLKLSVVGVPAFSLLVAAGPLPLAQVAMLVNIPMNVAAMMASTAIICREALSGVSRDACLLVVPAGLLGLACVHDVLMFFGVLDRPLFLSMYYRSIFTIGIAMVLMRRLGDSLMQLDQSNDRLRRALADREAELERMHEEDRRKAAEQALHEERQRLVMDLHDGLSGHLASIIAQSEEAGVAGIESTAREALDDLRLVIHSLDIGDGELRVALSSLRERLERQLHRIGVELEWSTARLPEVGGVTPTHALNVLRIVQEAVTNAIRHGGARHIRVAGSRSPEGCACLCVENDGVPFSCSELAGNGLANMQRRVAQLGGEIHIEAMPTGTRVLLLLPLTLLPADDAAVDMRNEVGANHALGLHLLRNAS
jgi:two-component system sensor histidine kinase UhpB